MADSPRGVDTADSVDFDDSNSNKQNEKKKSRRPPSEFSHRRIPRT
jgi:hypothetical protein